MIYNKNIIISFELNTTLLSKGGNSMIIGIGETRNPICPLNFGTHNGIFHCDEVVGMAILELAHMTTKSYVVRTRDLNELNKLPIVIDVGGGKFDHHRKGFNQCRSTGEMYASAGLMWKEFAEATIKNVANEVGVSISADTMQEIKKEIDREVILPIDMEDNGIKKTIHMFSFIPQFLPTWLQTQNFDCHFKTAESIAFDILKGIIKDKIAQAAAPKELQKRFEDINEGILEIPAQTFPWLKDVVNYNKIHNNCVKFVIFPYPAGGWAAQCVPLSVEEEFEQLVPFPEEWAGGNENTLPKICGIQGAISCHNLRFFAKATDKQAIVEMCKTAMRKEKK